VSGFLEPLAVGKQHANSPGSHELDPRQIDNRRLIADAAASVKLLSICSTAVVSRRPARTTCVIRRRAQESSFHVFAPDVGCRILHQNREVCLLSLRQVTISWSKWTQLFSDRFRGAEVLLSRKSCVPLRRHGGSDGTAS